VVVEGREKAEIDIDGGKLELSEEGEGGTVHGV
jgi:hypothetical protein